MNKNNQVYIGGGKLGYGGTSSSITKKDDGFLHYHDCRKFLFGQWNLPCTCGTKVKIKSQKP